MKRLIDVIISILGLLLLSPLFIVIAICIRCDSRGPVFYKQSRVGKNNIDFKLFKFRSMKVDEDNEKLITIGDRDPRITRFGYYIRKYKIDELPQLINVFTGDMSIVGPRPEVRKYVELYNEYQMNILSVRPGITDYASIKYMEESLILGKSPCPDKTYIEEIMPAKLELSMLYVNDYTLSSYFKLIFFTIIKIFRC